MVLEWVDSLRERYRSVERYGGPGDHGCDVIAVSQEDPDVWDNYQCKHYERPLQPNVVWVELGKLVYYSHRGEFAFPRKYYFVAPHGVGTKLSNLLRKPDALRTALLQKWDTHCRTKIRSTPVELDAALKAHINGLDFSIFAAIQPHQLLRDHAKTRWHLARFGGGFPARPPADSPPSEPTEHEATYVRQLLDAYGERLGQSLAAHADIAGVAELRAHFGDSRIEFYSAESLRSFSRDTLPPGEFERLQDDVHSGIRDDLRADYPDGYGRVVAVVKMARTLQLSDHALQQRLSIRDRGGICHQLANDGKVKWVR